MPFQLKIIIVAIVSYFLGNISPAILVGRLHGIDIRKEGSGNAGTTNVLRVLGVKAAVATLAIDVLKGYVAVRIGLNYGYRCHDCIHLRSVRSYFSGPI